MATVEPTTAATVTGAIAEAPATAVLAESLSAATLPYTFVQPATAFNFVPTTYTQVVPEPLIQYKPASKVNYLKSQRVERPTEALTRRSSVAAPQPMYAAPTVLSRAYSQPVFIMPARVVYPTATTTVANVDTNA